VQSSTPGTAGSSGEVTGLGVASSSSTSADPRIRNDDQPTGGGSATLWNRIRRLEKITSLELDASYDKNARGDLQAALNHAKVAIHWPHLAKAASASVRPSVCPVFYLTFLPLILCIC